VEPQPSKKGTGFVQPMRPHEHWHIDVAYLNVGARRGAIHATPDRRRRRALDQPVSELAAGSAS
jgi:hypothetical protein